MLDALRPILSPDQWPVFVLVSARLTGLMLTAPVWSMAVLPRAARAAITVMLAIALMPLAPPVAAPERVLDMPLPVAAELVIGIVIGLTAAVFVQGAAFAGEVLALQMGLSLGPALAPTPDVPVTGVSQLQSTLALMIYLSIGGHLALLRGLADSLQTLPPGGPIAFDAGGRAAAALAGTLFTCALRAAAPVMATLLLVNVALAILGRAVPQLNAMMVALPITIGVGLVMVGISMPFLASALTGWMGGLPDSVGATLSHFRVR